MSGDRKTRSKIDKLLVNLQLNISFENRNYTAIKGDWESKMTKYATVTNEQMQTGEVERKLSQLDYLSTNRFLWGPVLNALQQSVIEQVQVTKLSGEQTYAREDSHIVNVGTTRKVIPAVTTEKISLSIAAKDLKPNDQNYTKYKESLCSYSYFAKRLGRRDGFVMDGVLSQLTIDPLDPNRQFVTFTLATHFPEVHRSE